MHQHNLYTINNNNKKISKIWGEGNIKDVTYRLMFYVIKAEVDDGLLLYNVVTSELIHLNKKEMTHLSKLPCMHETWMDELIKKHFLVPADFDEKKFVDGLRTTINLLDSKKDIISYVILPTTGCNARCYYCFEEGVKPESMSDETADKIIRYIAEHRRDEKINLHWFGGEPLLGIHQIDRICNGLRKLNIPFVSQMSTNGYLFDNDLILRAKTDWNLIHVQIPMDGTRDSYNKAKAYINPTDDPYNKVMDNIGYLLESDIETEIRLNLSRINYNDLIDLVNVMADRFINYNNIILYVASLKEGCGAAPNISNSPRYNLEETYELKNHILNYTLADPKFLSQFVATFCMVEDDTIMFTPSGKIGKCDIHVGDIVVGNVDEGITDKELLKEIREHILLPKCSTCPFYPSCIILNVCDFRKDFVNTYNCDETYMDYKIKCESTIMKKLYKQYKES